MSKITNVRLPNAATGDYNPDQINQLIRSLEQVILQLNSTYTPIVTENKDAALTWYEAGQIMANKYLRKYSIPSAATETTLYTVPDANTGILRSLRVTNAGAASALITVTQYTAGVAHVLQKVKTLAVNDTVDVFNGIPCIVEAADIIKVTSSVADVHFYLSYLEVDRN